MGKSHLFIELLEMPPGEDRSKTIARDEKSDTNCVSLLFYVTLTSSGARHIARALRVYRMPHSGIYRTERSAVYREADKNREASFLQPLRPALNDPHYRTGFFVQSVRLRPGFPPRGRQIKVVSPDEKAVTVLVTAHTKI